MGRGSEQQRELSQQQLATQNALVANQQKEREEGRRMLLPQVNELLTSEGYGDPEKTAMTGQAMEATDAGYGAAKEMAENRVQRTGNTAGEAGEEIALARDREAGKANTARELQTEFAVEKQRRRMAGRQLLANMYGIDTNLLSNVAGLPIGALNANAAGIAHNSIGVGPVSFGT